jgi:glutathione S-transferase
MAKYTLYSHPLSPFAYFIQTVLEYKGIEYNFEFVDLTSGKQKEESYLAKHPYGLVPLLSDGTNNYYESYAIFEHLEEAFPDKNMLAKNDPKRTLGRALCLAYITQIVPTGRDFLMHAFGRVIMTNEQKEKAYETLKSRLTTFEKELLSLSSGLELNAIDALFFQGWQNLKFSVPGLEKDFPKLESYCENLKKVQAIQKVEASPFVIKVREFVKGMALAK